jgi:uncharacterized membrane protein
MNLHPTILPAFFEISRIPVSMCSGGIVVLVMGLLAAKNDLAEARGLDKIVALANLCFATPLGVFGAEHLSDAREIMPLVPAYMPWRLFWTYFVGVALIAASLSIATKIQVRWSGMLFGIMMVIFETMIIIPGVHAHPNDRFAWIFVCREFSFASGGWILAGDAMSAGGQRANKLIIVGRVIIGVAAMFYGVQHFLHPVNVPGVPLEKLMPTWIPGRVLISYLTGSVLLVGGAAILLASKTRMAATYLGSWILLLALVVYGPILIASLLDPSTDVKVDGINYFFDALLYAGAILALASATPRSE